MYKEATHTLGWKSQLCKFYPDLNGVERITLFFSTFKERNQTITLFSNASSRKCLFFHKWVYFHEVKKAHLIWPVMAGLANLIEWFLMLENICSFLVFAQKNMPQTLKNVFQNTFENDVTQWKMCTLEYILALIRITMASTMQQYQISQAGLAEMGGQGRFPPPKFSRSNVVVVWLTLTPFKFY